MNLFKMMTAASLAALICLSSVSCSQAQDDKNQQNGTATQESITETFGGDKPIDTEELGRIEEEIEKSEIFDEILSWVGYSDKGPLLDKDSCKTVEIKKASDLDPYRQYLPELTPEEEAEFLGDKNGYVLLIEVTSKGENYSYSTTSVYNNGVNIEILISEWEEPEVQPEHTFYLYYIPSTHYSGEPVRVLFI